MYLNDVYKALNEIVDNLNQWSGYVAIHEKQAGVEPTERNLRLWKLAEEAQEKADCFMKSATILAKALDVTIIEVEKGYYEVREKKDSVTHG